MIQEWLKEKSMARKRPEKNSSFLKDKNMKKVELNHLLEAGVHFGHLTSKRHPNMSPYIFMEKNGMHIIDLNKTKFKLDQALLGLKKIAQTGRKILFVATKKQSKFVLEKFAKIFEQGLVSSKDLANELINILKSKRDEIVFKMRLTSKDEFEILSKRVENLEKKIDLFKNLNKKKTKKVKKS